MPLLASEHALLALMLPPQPQPLPLNTRFVLKTFFFLLISFYCLFSSCFGSYSLFSTFISSPLPSSFSRSVKACLWTLVCSYRYLQYVLGVCTNSHLTRILWRHCREHSQSFTRPSYPLRSPRCQLLKTGMFGFPRRVNQQYFLASEFYAYYGHSWENKKMIMMMMSLDLDNEWGQWKIR